MTSLILTTTIVILTYCVTYTQGKSISNMLVTYEILRDGRTRDEIKSSLQNRIADGQDQTDNKGLLLRTAKTGKKYRLCIQTIERMGNSMFEYASVYGIARDKGMAPALYDTNDLIFRHFEGMSVTRNVDKCSGGTWILRNRQDCAFNEEDVAFDARTDINVNGHFESWVYFRKYFDEIRKEFTFKADILRKAETAFNTAVATKYAPNRANVTYVTMHVRRSDVLEDSYWSSYGYTSPGVDYYVKAMNYYRHLYKQLVFVVCSDRLDWAKQNLNFPDVVFASGDSAPVDMAIISMGNHTIMSVGTFGWWGSFLAGGTTVAYRHPARKGSEYRTHFSHDMRDFFLPHWIIMD